MVRDRVFFIQNLKINIFVSMTTMEAILLMGLFQFMILEEY